VTARELWVQAYQGEVLGEALFGGLAERERDPGRKRKLEMLTLLERATKQIGEPVLDRHGWDRGDTAATLAAAASFVEAAASQSWEEFVGAFEPITAKFLAIYRELVELSDDEDDRLVAEAYVAHERALAAFGRRELAQEEGDPLQPIMDLPHVGARA
jgi:hypothetical protein